MAVSILILLEVILEDKFEGVGDFMLGVSILILLEVILEDCFDWIDEQEGGRFNPYFTGSNSGSVGSYIVLGCS